MIEAPQGATESATRNRSIALRVAGLAILLFSTWLLWSGLFKPLLIGLGVLSTALTVYVAKRMGFFDTNLYASKVSFRYVGYLAWLGKEVVLSSLEVARVVLNPRLPISPTVIEIDSRSPNQVDQAILAISITLTPGTLAMDVHDGRLLIHALTKTAAAELTAGEMNSRVARMREE